MKKIITFFTCLIAIPFIAHATVRTVSNNSDIPAQYTSLVTAINEAGEGDTILVAGSQTSYGNITIDKELVIYGAGYNNPYGENTILDYLNLTTQNASIGASGSRISGIYVRYNLYLYGNYTGGGKMENVVIERCRVQYIDFDRYDVAYTNDTIRNCLIQNSYIYFSYGTYTDVIFHNNIFDNEYMYQSSSADLSSVFLENNVMLDETTNFFYGGTSYGIRNMVVQNNIFYKAEPQGCIGCTFNNNITYLNSNDIIPGTDNTGSGNITATDPDFKNYPFAGGAFDYQYDLSLDAGSPGLDAGTDGSDIGITGGLMTYTPGANPRIPQVTEISFPDNASSVKVGGSLNVTFKAKKQD